MLLHTCARRFAVSARPVSTMPLRARVTNPAIMARQSSTTTTTSSSSSASSSSPSSNIVLTEQPGDDPHDVLFASHFGLRSITLNRPKKLNSLNASMARKILSRLREWRKSQLAEVVVIKGAGRAFCAGGDVAALAMQNQQGIEGQRASTDYFALEYVLDHAIATYPKPYLALLDGITMGGGVGLSLHAPFRIATENTVFAMPETTIGFFPDVGASFFLPRLDGALGLYLALTSAQLHGVDVFWSGVATHYLHSTSLPDLEARLAELRFPDSAPLQTRLRLINATLEEFCTGFPKPPTASLVGGDLRAAIDYVFQPAHRSLDAIFTALRGLEDHDHQNPPEIVDWAKKTRETILQRSPTSAHVTLRQFREGARWDIAETFRRELGLAGRFMSHPDFVAGVSALLIHKPKTKPIWTPARMEDVTEKEVARFFSSPPADLPLADDADGQTGWPWKTYPHAWIGLPGEGEVRGILRQMGETARTKGDVVEEVVKRRRAKAGVREKVEEILGRKTVDQEGSLVWRS